MLEKILNKSKKTLTSLLVASSIVLAPSIYSDGKISYSVANAKQPKLENVYTPSNTADLSKITPQDIGNCLTGKYVKTIGTGNNQQQTLTQGSAEVKVLSDVDGFNQPAILLYESHSLKEKIFFSDIHDVKGIVVSDGGDFSTYVIFEQRIPQTGNLATFTVKYFGLEPSCGINRTSEAISTAADFYKRKKIEYQLNKDPKKAEKSKTDLADSIKDPSDELTCPEKNCPKCPEPKVVKQELPLMNIAFSDREKICAGGSVDGLAAQYVGAVSFEECVYDPFVSSSKGMGDLLVSITKHATENPGGLFLSCGNASVPSAKKCAETFGGRIKEKRKGKPDYTNFELSFDRAATVLDAALVEMPDVLKNIALLAYPNGTNLDERTVKIYYVR
ncbi:hypothetical protein HOK51_03705 [Candidatus Woesearchaeota archaeon]|jgi:hypothetical protein|nr:hypothetical protein [Candidatus Woesearchaeota archaeon]MBT6518927.1 hypothetical protein [Candidatus Woesearchaeota archaeon]MBT7367595.1 hypothetical protein [Candidatus Woesearchaeota archaeon]